MDEALSLPTEESVQIALRTQQLVAYETGVTDTVDPLGGSYYLEHLTDTIENEAMNYIKRIDEMGGSPQAIEQGFVQKEIQNSAYQYQIAVEKNDRVVVGVNKFQVGKEPAPNILRVDPKVRELQVDKIDNLKKSRDQALVASTLKTLKKAAQGEDNLMPPILDAVRAYATLGEICDVLRDVFGEYKPSSFF